MDSNKQRELIAGWIKRRGNKSQCDLEVSWMLNDVDVKEKDPDRYTGPGGYVWVARLSCGTDAVGSIGFTDREIVFVKQIIDLLLKTG